MHAVPIKKENGVLINIGYFSSCMKCEKKFLLENMKGPISNRANVTSIW